MSEDDFVEAVTQGQSVAPLYFSFAANRNRELRDLLADDVSVPTLTMAEALAGQHSGAVVIDAGEDMAFAAGHLRGSVNVGLGGRFAEYAGEVMAPETPIVLVTPPGHEAEAKVRLARIGFDNVLGALEHPVDTFLAHPELIEPLDQLDQSSPTVVFCAGGYRSAIASSLLRSRGFTDVSDLIGGYTAWETHLSLSTREATS